MSFKYSKFLNKEEWESKVIQFLRKHHIKSSPEVNNDDMVIIYEGRGKTLAVWDMFDKEGWVITDEYFKNNGLAEQLIGEFYNG